MNNDKQENIQNIGIFDSGMGGLNVLSELKKIISNCDYTYFADTKNIPYGTKSNDEILLYARNIINFFKDRNINNIIIACNTVSAIAYKDLQNEFKDSVKLYPVLQCGIRFASEIYSKLDNIAVLGTKATIKSGLYEKLLKEINPNLKVINIDGTGLVEIIEEGLYANAPSFKFIKKILEPINTYNIKNLILGCTHYGYLVPFFKQICDVKYYNPSYYLANYMKENFKNILLDGQGDVEYFVSSNPEKFKQNIKRFYNIKNVDTKLIDIN